MIGQPDAVVFEHHAREYSFWEHTCGRERYSHFLERLPTRVGPVLDAGCGSGALSLALASRAHSVLGIDRSPELIALACQRQRMARITNVHFQVGDIEHLPSREDSKHDVVVCYRVLHHLGPTGLSALRQSVAAGGCLLIFDFVVSANAREKRWTWHAWQALKSFVVYRNRYGSEAARRIVRFRLSRGWLRHVCSDELLSPAQFRKTMTDALPGVQVFLDDRGMSALWRAGMEVGTRPLGGLGTGEEG